MRWWRRVFRRARLERELDAELRFHLEQQIADERRRGMSEADARRQAHLRFGGLDQAKEACRDARGTRWLTDLGRDAFASVRTLRATPTFTVVALAVLTLGIGASTAIFSVVDAVILRGLPFDESDRLVAVSEVGGNGRLSATSPQNFLDWRARQDVFTTLAAMTYGGVDLERDGTAAPESLRGKRVTADFFSVLRAAPLIGRPFTAEQEVEGRDRVALISYGVWQRRFGGAPDVVGRRLPTEDGDLDILGVMPPGFDYPPGAPEPTEVWLPYVVPGDQRSRTGASHYWTLQLLARLREGVSVDRAQSRLDQLTAPMMAEDPQWFSGMAGVKVQPLHEALTGSARTWMLLLLGAVGCVLLLACVNVANLLLVRATTRSREIGIRAALGATRWDLARALLLESLVLFVAGAGLGILVAWWGVDVLRHAMPADLPRIASVAVNRRVLGAALTAALVTGLVFGLVPALPFSRPVLNDALKDGGRTQTAGRARQWLRTALVVSEVALAVVLLVGSALFLVSFARVTAVDLGMDVNHVVTAQMRPPQEATGKRARMLDVVSRARTIPGVEVASAAGSVPLWGGTVSDDIRVAGQPRRPGRATMADRREVSVDFFRALRVPLLAGRVFTDDNRRDGPPVCILTASAASKYFGGPAGAVGRAVVFGGTQRDIVGVVGDVRQWGPERPAREAVFIPLTQSDVTWAMLVLRTSGDVVTILPAVRGAIRSEFPDAIVPEARTLESYLGDMLAPRRFNMLLLGLFGLLGVVIAGLGIYGVMAYAVTQRTQEIGIRMALGATPAAILRSVIGRTSVVVGLGLALGLAGAWELSGVVRTFLFHVQVHELNVYAGVCGVLIATGLAAAYAPARRAARVDPLVALRME